jgi:thioredoxin-like negative regulator of GroEL
MAIMLTAEWSEPSQLLKSMIAEMPAHFPNIKFYWVDCDSSEDLIDHFEVDEVPSLILVHPHK